MYSYVPVCYWYVTRIYSYVPVCYSYVHPYVNRMYSYGVLVTIPTPDLFPSFTNSGFPLTYLNATLFHDNILDGSHTDMNGILKVINVSSFAFFFYSEFASEKYIMNFILATLMPISGE